LRRHDSGRGSLWKIEHEKIYTKPITIESKHITVKKLLMINRASLPKHVPHLNTKTNSRPKVDKSEPQSQKPYRRTRPPVWHFPPPSRRLLKEEKAGADVNKEAESSGLPS